MAKNIRDKKDSDIKAWLIKHRQMGSIAAGPPPATRFQLIRVWLKENVLESDMPETVTLSDFEFDWDSLTGSFRLALDTVVAKERFHLFVDIAGQIQYAPPMLYSPFGVPASYAAVRLDFATETAVRSALETVFPRLRGYGYHRDVGLEISGHSAISDRIYDQSDFTKKAGELTRSGFAVTASVRPV